MLVESRAYPKFQNVRPPPEIVRAMACAVSGLTEVEARTLFALALAKFGDLDRRAVGLLQREKARVLLAGGALAMTEPKAGFAQVGGLEHAKTWAEGVTPLINDPGEARKFGLKIPSGLLLVGVSGTGKSLLAESLAHEWRLPLLRFDVGSCFGSLVGESERNVRRMIEMAQALRPCVVFVDEIEKGLGGDSLDGGTTSRVKATLLTWLQDKPDSIFVVATANDLTRLKSMPELIRAGRFDQTFFVDLPDCKTRAEIFVIHFGKAGHAVAPEWLQEAAQACPRYSGAEIEAIVQQALRFAFAAEPRGLTREMLMRSVRDVKPLADTMAESVSRLRAWCRDGRARLAGGALENEIVIEKKTNGQDSLSDLAAN
jgi:SpoVK/Ycf46/Vps4 family AAA+-type ATPase